MDSLGCKEWAHRIVPNLKDFLVTLYVPNVSKHYEVVLISNNWKQLLRPVRGYKPRLKNHQKQTFHFVGVSLIQVSSSVLYVLVLFLNEIALHLCL
jgi:hypothetical protein